MSDDEYEEMMEAKAYVQQLRLKVDLHGRVNRIVDEEMKEGLGGMSVSSKVTAALNEVLFDYIHEMGRDLEVFARHAGRKIINVHDVKLCARKNESLVRRPLDASPPLPALTLCVRACCRPSIWAS